MQLARVIGTVVASHKDEKFTGTALLLIQPITNAGEPTGKALVACDAAGAGVGDEVFFVRGREAAYPFYPVDVPTDASIIGIVDHWTVS